MAKYCHFWTFCKGYMAKWLQNDRFWERSFDQPTRWLIRTHVKETGTRKWRENRQVFTWPYLIHFIPTNMVRARIRGILRMRKKTLRQQFLWTWCQSVVPNNFPRDFGPWVAFVSWDSDAYRHRQAGREGGRERERDSRALDHVRQIPFIHLDRLTHRTNFDIYIYI